MLRVSGLRKSFGRVEAVRDVSFALRPGTITALIGENGAGKTTTLRMIVGFLRPDGGTVELGASRLGYIPEHPAYFPWPTGASILAMTAEAFHVPAEKRRLETPGLCAGLGFDVELLRRRPAVYSAGNLRKFAYLQNLIAGPDLLIADESFAALDPPSIKKIRELFLELRAAGTTILVSSHILAELEKVADDFILMHSGVVAARSGSGGWSCGRSTKNGPGLESLFSDPRSSFRVCGPEVSRRVSIKQNGNFIYDLY